MRRITVLCAALLLIACSGQTVRKAAVERVEVAVTTDPLSVQVTAYGYLSSGCATLRETEQRREGNAFFVTITQTEPADKVCTPEAPPFIEEVMLSGELSSGAYTVNVNGVAEPFTLP